MDDERGAGDVFTVLFVCTGNICRSALAERLARAYLDDALGEQAGAVHLASAGVGAVVGSEMHPGSALVLQGFGADPAGFVARQLNDVMAVEADLTLAMTRAHRREVLERAPRALARTFTLREAADVVARIPEDDDLPGETFANRARSLVAAMAATRSGRHDSSADDVPDPIGGPAELHLEAGELIAEALIPLLDRIVALQRPPTPSDPASAREGSGSATAGR